MRKIAATILSLFAFTGAAFVFNPLETTVFCAAEDVIQQTQKAVGELIAPPSYEEYLPLQNPSDVAVCDQFIAVADGKQIYVYDKKAALYRVYEHTANVTKLQFDVEETLYFLDSSTYLHTLNPENLALTETGFVCSNFLIEDNVLYFTNTSGGMSQLRKTYLSDLKISSATTLLDRLSLSPALAFFEGELYYTDGGKYLHKTNPDSVGNTTFVAAFQRELLSFSIAENAFTCSTSDGEFYSYDLLALSESKESEKSDPLLYQTGGYKALSAYNDFVYTVKNESVCVYSIDDNAFTNYEIGAESASLERINSAKELCLTQDKLFIADAGNNRISVYDTEKKSFLSPIPTELSPDHLASDGKTLLLSNKTELKLLSLNKNNYGETLFSFKAFEGNAVGAVEVYGKYYLATDKNQFLCLSQSQSGWTLTKSAKTSTRYPTLLASDAYGYLYAKCGSSIYRYTEESFLSPIATDTELCSSLPQNTKKIAVDYRANLYALSENTLYKYAQDANGEYKTVTEKPLTESQVIGVTPSTRSFALSIEEDAAYLLDENHYLVKRTDFSLQTMKNIPVNGADKTVLDSKNTALSMVEIQENALMIEFDLQSLRGKTVFPYVEYKRNEKAQNAIKLGKTDVYEVLAVYNEQKRQYSTYLVYASSCKALPTKNYLTAYETEKTGYLSNAVSLYRLPFISKETDLCSMQRGAKITLLGEVNNLDRSYYHVRYETEDKQAVVGYLPKAYVSPSDGNTPVNAPSFGAKKSKKDSIGRLIYLLLSFGAICILTDYLILRKPKDESKDEE